MNVKDVKIHNVKDEVSLVKQVAILIHRRHKHMVYTVICAESLTGKNCFTFPYIANAEVVSYSLKLSLFSPLETLMAYLLCPEGSRRYTRALLALMICVDWETRKRGKTMYNVCVGYLS